MALPPSQVAEAQATLAFPVEQRQKAKHICSVLSLLGWQPGEVSPNRMSMTRDELRQLPLSGTPTRSWWVVSAAGGELGNLMAWCLLIPQIGGAPIYQWVLTTHGNRSHKSPALGALVFDETDQLYDRLSKMMTRRMLTKG